MKYGTSCDAGLLSERRKHIDKRFNVATYTEHCSQCGREYSYTRRYCHVPDDGYGPFCVLCGKSNCREACVFPIQYNIEIRHTEPGDIIKLGMIHEVIGHESGNLYWIRSKQSVGRLILGFDQVVQLLRRPGSTQEINELFLKHCPPWKW